MADKLSPEALKAIRAGELARIAKDNDKRREQAKQKMPATARSADSRWW